MRTDPFMAPGNAGRSHPAFAARLISFLLAPIALLLPTGCEHHDDTSTANITTTAAGSKSGANTHSSKGKYHCPMHPSYISDRPGDCPICNMKLVPIKNENDAPDSAPGSGSSTNGTAAATTANAQGRVPIVLSDEKQQLIGVRWTTVEKRDLKQLVRTTATFEHNETTLARVSPRFAGWVRHLDVNFTGQEVSKGDPLLEVYSPEILSAENEYLLAFERLSQLPPDTTDPQRESARRMVDSARRRLQLWEIGEDEIHDLETARLPRDQTIIRSPVSGHVITKLAVQGKSFMAGETLYEIAELSDLWLRAYVFEYELPLIKIGQKARVLLPYLGDRTYESKVTFIYPHIEQQTRRAEIRLEVENAHHTLRPQMWANVEIEADYGEALAIPASAVIDTGTRLVAFVQGNHRHIEPRELKIGIRAEEYWEVLEGVSEGENVVTRALFLVDAESQLKAAISGMASDDTRTH